MAYKLGMPGAAVAMLSHDVDERTETMKSLRTMFDAVLHLAKSQNSKLLSQLLEDIGWHKETLALDIMAMCQQSNYDASDRELIKLMSRLRCGTSTTKNNLESTFGHLTDVAARHNKNRRIGPFQKWMYSCSSPYGREECPQSFPTPNCWLRFSLSDSKLVEEFNAVTDVNGTPLPEISNDDIRQALSKIPLNLVILLSLNSKTRP